PGWRPPSTQPESPHRSHQKQQQHQDGEPGRKPKLAAGQFDTFLAEELAVGVGYVQPANATA
ncbi:MAG TPA: hypothetical protein PLA97_14870, partial [Rubrivivax sp.]|nr:hypothetical protein [Rubrivivax sp.]